MAAAPGPVWKDFRDNFPWRDLVLGLLVPKALLFVGISRNDVFAWAAAAAAWSVGLYVFSRVRDGRMNLFAVFAMVAILARVIVILAAKNAMLYILTQALDYAFYGALFLLSLFARRSIVQVFAETYSVKVPAKVAASGYDRSAWRIVTAVWGAAYMVAAAALTACRMVSMKAAAAIDIVTNWPLTCALILFTVVFPRRYWTGKLGDIG